MTKCLKKIQVMNLDFFCYFDIDLTPVLPPPSKVISCGLFVCHAPLVKSGTSTEDDLFFKETSLNRPAEVQEAASYTS